MKDIFSSLEKSSKRIKLSENEKAKSREFLRQYVALRPVRSMQNTPVKKRGFFGSFTTSKILPVAASVLMASFFGTTGYAAEGSVPGDTLYPVKVHVNENMRGVFTLGKEARAEWNARLVVRRLEEAGKLEMRDDVPVEVIEKLEQRFEKHAEKMQALVSRIEEDKGVEIAMRVSANIEAMLNAHETVIENAINRGVLPEFDNRKVWSALQETHGKMADVRKRTEKHLMEMEDEEREKVIEWHDKNIAKRIDAFEKKVLEVEATKAGRDAAIARTKKFFEEAGERRDNGEHQEALASFREAMKSAHDVEVGETHGFLKTREAMYRASGEGKMERWDRLRKKEWYRDTQPLSY